MGASLGACSGVLWDLAAVDWGLLRRRLSGNSNRTFVLVFHTVSYGSDGGRWGTFRNRRTCKPHGFTIGQKHRRLLEKNEGPSRFRR